LQTKVGPTEIQGYSDLIWNTGSSTLEVTGDISGSGNISGSAFYGDGSNLSGVGTDPAGSNTQLQFNNGGSFGASSNLVFNGNKLGVGTDSPEGKLHVYSGEAGIAPSALADELVIEGAGSTGISILTPNNQVGRLYFGDSDNSARGYVLYDHSSDIMKFSVASANRLVINNAGNVGIGHSFPENPDHKLAVIGDISASVNISASAFYGDGSNLSNVGSELIVKEEGSNITTAATSINFVGAYVTASNAGNDVTVTVNAGAGGAGGAIGAAEDGDYTDGLFTDFTAATTIGTAVDKFNEVFKILAPSPAPSLSQINSDTSAGISAKLSFGSSGPVTGYTSSNTAAGFSAVDVNGLYESDTNGNNFRLGIYNGSQDITGFLNHHVVESVTNNYLAYSNDAFGNAETGTLKLELNGNTIHSVNLASLVGAGNPFTGSASSLTSDSGFTNVSVTASSFDGNNAEWYIFKHRTAKYKVDTNAQIAGWNYLRVVHTVGGTDYGTSYVEWINDPSGASGVANMSASIGRIENINLVGSKYLSGVQYNTDATANYKVDLSNLYTNVYAATGTPISFGVTNSTTPSAQAVPAIGGGENNTKILGVTASLNCNTNSLVNGAITANVTVTHPLKATISATGSATTGNGFLIDNRTLSSTNTSEKFHDETHRKQSGSFDSQSDVTGPGLDWNSNTHMTSGNGGHADGLIMFNQRLYSPVDADIPNGGDFSGLANVAGGQPDYSSVTGTRSFFRKIQNTSGGDLFNFRIESTKNGTTYDNSSLGTANVNFFVKIPGTTGWMDISQNFVYGSIVDGSGAKVSAASDSNTNVITFGTASVADDSFIMLKILADESWQGYISQLDFTLPANQNQTTPNVLSDLEADSNTGVGAKLSFGSSNAISIYSNVQGGGVGSMSTIDSNGDYTVSGNRRGIFSAAQTIEGELNEAISANGGGDFPAKAFFNGYSGSLVLEVNGSDIHTIDLASSLSGINTVNGNGSRLNVSAVAYSTEANVPNYNKPYRTGTYEISTSDQRIGWNYARIKHGSNTTNYVEWVIEPSGAVDNTAVSAPVLSNFGHTVLYYQSGIGYFAANPTGSFDFLGTNFYTNVYSNNAAAISFPGVAGCTVTNIRGAGSGLTTSEVASSSRSMPALNNSSDCELTSIQVTGTLQYNGPSTSISGGLGQFSTPASVSASGRLLHPFKTNKTTSTLSKTGFMRFSGSIGSTTRQTDEYFGLETFRVISGSYDTQLSLTSSANSWNSQTAMTSGGHGNGLATINGLLISPKQIGNSGDTRNVADGGVLQAPDGNPNYSSISGAREFYRYFDNNTSNDRSSITITLYGSGSLVKKATSLGANGNFYLEAKIPGKTAWLDVGTAYSSNNASVDGAGALDGAAPGNPAINIGGGGTSVVCNFNGQSLLGTGTGPDFVALRVSADANWIGYLTRIRVQYS
jgi:hypothetical protein